MKTNKIILWTMCIGLALIILCVVLPFLGVEESWWDDFCYIGDMLGYIANLTIVAAVFKFLTKETLDIKGIGRIKVSRMQNNIQDLTNIINMKLYHGHNFKRGPLLDAFYQNSNFRFISVDPDYIKLSEATDIAQTPLTPDHQHHLKMLVNLSNHPFSQWDDRQKEAAAVFGKCIDIDFPSIPANFTEAEIEELADSYLEKIRSFGSDICVHIMGEQTFCFSLISKLLQHNIQCIASCSDRDVNILPDGSKQVRFHFTRFRRYC